MIKTTAAAQALLLVERRALDLAKRPAQAERGERHRARS